ncbi:unnamed protein product [Litomosoides sigmodontis]|uniref:Translin family protein n=1 Tax=Litomosoides sigmodontis TaxID=42156 RepID=A0A3P6SNF3_LITSI|nr:unnamed protein product [Litomosoides sigmodontis]
MSGAHTGSWKSHDRGRGRNKRSHDNGVDSSDCSTSSRYQRIITEDEKKDFVNYQKEIDERRDRYEKIVKLSRDVIIECKRIIFQLHRIVVVDTPKNKAAKLFLALYVFVPLYRISFIHNTADFTVILGGGKLIINPDLSSEEILKEADKRLDEVRCKMFRQIAKELCNLDQYYYIKSYDWALEEYIEALAFHKFLISGEVLLYNEVIGALQFVDAESGGNEKLYMELPEITYLMGLFDVGGELMRLAISEISSGNSDIAVSIVNYMRSLHGCYELLGNIMSGADWTKKSQVFRDCLMKVENALYKWKIREKDTPTKEASICASILT